MLTNKPLVLLPDDLTQQLYIGMPLKSHNDLFSLFFFKIYIFHTDFLL